MRRSVLLTLACIGSALLVLLLIFACINAFFFNAFFFYCCIVFLIHMLTSVKQNLSIRGQLYLGLFITLIVEFITLLVEICMNKIGAGDFNNQFRVVYNMQVLLRSVYVVVATMQVLHAMFTYREHELLKHSVRTMVDDVLTMAEEGLQRYAANYNFSSGSNESNCSNSFSKYFSGSDESLSNCSSVWNELADKADRNPDPDNALQEPSRQEEVGENTITPSVSRRYNLRPRNKL